MPRFMRYVKRFGHIYAAFLTPRMQELSGKCEPIKGPGVPAIEYLSRKAVSQDCDEAWERKLDDLGQLYDEVLRKWPRTTTKLPSSAFLN